MPFDVFAQRLGLLGCQVLLLALLETQEQETLLIRKCEVVNDAKAASLSFTWRCPAKLSRATRPRDDRSQFRVFEQIGLQSPQSFIAQVSLDERRENRCFYELQCRRELSDVACLWYANGVCLFPGMQIGITRQFCGLAKGLR